MKVKTILLLIVLLALMLYQNNKVVDLNFLWMNFQIQLWIIICFSTIIGFIAGLILLNKQKIKVNPESKNIHNNEDEEYLK